MSCNRCSAPYRGRYCRHCELAMSHEGDPRLEDGREGDGDEGAEEEP